MKDARDALAEIETRTGALPERIRAAFLTVDRARFVRPCDRAWAWDSLALPLDTPHGPAFPSVDAMVAAHGSYRAAQEAATQDFTATISQPLVYAMAFRALDLDVGHRDLELGSATGYGAALAAQIVGASGRVITVDVNPHLVRDARTRLAECGNVTVLHDDGLARPDLVGAHDRVWFTFAVPAMPPSLLEALGETGVLLAPVGAADGQTLTRYTRGARGVELEALGRVGFVAARARIDDPAERASARKRP